METRKVLIVDDELLIRNFLKEVLDRKGYTTAVAEDGKSALAKLREEEFDLVITDMKLPDTSGLEVLKKTKELSLDTVVVIITAFGSIENAVEAMRLGAFNYLLKPFSPDAIEAVIAKANEHLAILQENRYLRQTVARRNAGLSSEIVAKSPSMKKVLEDVDKIAQSHASVLITGESGTGKEVIAHAIHFRSSRNQGPLICVNCAAIPETLIESEFFGHEKGAFTGASSKRIGRFELANQGSLVLDEISEIPLLLQPKLLRVIQEQQFERVGGTKPVNVDVRLISTSNRNMENFVKEKGFREDLYYRLNVVPLHLPPLRERREDILPLAQHFLKEMCIENHFTKKELSQNAKDALMAYPWPGNIRELANIMERAVVLNTEPLIEAKHLHLSH